MRGDPLTLPPHVQPPSPAPSHENGPASGTTGEPATIITYQRPTTLEAHQVDQDAPAADLSPTGAT